MKNTILFSVFLACANQALADSSPSKFYGGFELGSAKVENRAQAIADTFVGILGGSTTVTQTVRNGAWRAFGGYKAFENADFELGYMQTRDFGLSVSGVTGGAVAYSASGSVQVSGIDYSVLLRPNRSTGLNGFFVRLGGHNYKVEGSTAVSVGGTTTSVNTKDSCAGMMYGIGYDTTITETIDIRFGITQLNKVGGITDNDATYLSVGVKGNF
jgi:hypothetical protein